MSEPKFTPGPWVAGGKQSHGTSVHGLKTVSVAWVPCASTHGELGHYAIDANEAHANAHLIAAAPDLYAALEEAVWCLERVGASETSRAMAVAQAGKDALAKARGEGQA